MQKKYNEEYSMSVKTLYRRSKLSPIHNITMANMDPPVKYNPIPDIFTRIDKSFPHRKSADGEALSFIDRIKEFIHFKKPNIDLPPVGEMLQKLKVPGLVILGVSFIAGLIYLAYKLYKNYSAQKAEDTINKIMADLVETAPDLMKLPGWSEKIRAEVEYAVTSGSENSMVEEIARIKTSVIDKQKSMGAKVGSGIDLFRSQPMTYKHILRGYGSGAVMPL